MVEIRCGEKTFGLGYTYDVFNDKNRNFRHIWTCHHSAVTERETMRAFKGGITNREREALREKGSHIKANPES